MDEKITERTPEQTPPSPAPRYRVDAGEETGPWIWHVGGDDVFFRIPLLLRLRRRGFRVGAAGSCDGRQFAEAGIPFWHYPLDRWINPLADLRSYRALCQLFVRHGPDLVHTFDTKPSIYATLAARHAGVRARVRTVTGSGYVFSSSSLPARLLRPALRRLQRRASAAADRTIFYNSDDRALFHPQRRVVPGRDVLIPGSGVDVELLQRHRPDEAQLVALRRSLDLGSRPVVLMIARLTREKGVVEFLAAARMLRRRTQAAFLLVGPLVSEGRQAIGRELIEAHAGTVRWLGWRDDVSALLALADLFVLPTFYGEGIPRVLLEAGAMRLPVVATDVPGCREVIEHGRNGLLIPPRNAAALAEAIAQLLHNPAYRRRLAADHHDRVCRNFHLDRIADLHAELYWELLQQLPGGQSGNSTGYISTDEHASRRQTT